MVHAARGLSLLLTICALVATAVAQTPQRGAGAATRDVYVSVLDRQGAPVPGLGTTDFVVKEDGMVREILEVKTADAPLQIALLIDDSTAASSATSYLRDGIAAFLERMRGPA